MPAPLSLRIKERYMAKRASGLSQQVAADAVGISVRSAQRIDRGELQPEGQQQRRRRHWRTRADPLADQGLLKVRPRRPSAPSLTGISWRHTAPDPCQHRRSRALLQPPT